MKTSTVILGASVALNLVLLGTIAAGLGGDATPAVRAKAATARATVPPPPPAGPGADTWSGLQQGTDFATQRDRLRAEGFPDNLIRAILGAQIREKYAAQRKAVEGGADLPFWKSPLPDPKVGTALRAIAAAERKELRDLLGPDPDDLRGVMYQRQIPGLSAEKAEQLTDISDRYNEQRMAIFGGGALAAVDGQKIAALEKAMHAEFAAVLTPQELEDYDLRAGRTASQLQYQMSAFNPTEAEYRALYKLQAAFDDQFPPMYGPISQADMKARSEAQKQMQADIAATLGTDRYAQYQRATDYNYRQTTQLVARLDLPPETADALYAIQKEYQQKQQDFYRSMRGTPLKLEDVRQQMTQLQQEANARVSTAFNGNAQAVDAYRTYGGQWLRNMVPSPRTSGPATFSTSGTVIISHAPGP